MDTPQHSAIANRGEPIPVLNIAPNEANPDPVSSSEQQHGHRKRDALKAQVDRVRGSLESVKDDVRGGGMQERLLNTLLARIIPPDGETNEDGEPNIDKRSRAYVDRPSFSLPLMSNNFRRFNSRIGIVFVFQNQLIHLFTWREPTQTLSFLAVFTFVCLQPALIPSIPLALVFFFVMIPSFLTRHPPPREGKLTHGMDPTHSPEMASAWSSYAYTVQPTAPPQRIKPTPEMSKDFFRNMRDLQNSMEDFSRVHDAAVSNIFPYVDFSDENLSSAVFLAIFVLLLLATITAHLVPWRLLALAAGWSATISGHPRAQEVMAETLEHQTVQVAAVNAQNWLQHLVRSDIVLDEPPEIQEVEIFELQRRHSQNVFVQPSPDGSRHSREGSNDEQAQETHDENWEPWMFTPSSYDPLSPQRLSGALPVGTQFFEEVQAPSGWIWRDKKWTLDLLSNAWVEDRCVTGVEVEQEGSRWVYDIAYPDASNQGNDAARGNVKSSIPKSWEEGTNRGRKGEWRRRRWIRLVERKAEKRQEPPPFRPTVLATLDPGMVNPGPVEADALVR